MSDKEFGDFDLMLELNPDWGLDSGVFLRANPQGVCFQVYVDYHDHGNVGWISTETTSGQKIQVAADSDVAVRRPNGLVSSQESRGGLELHHRRPCRHGAHR